MTPSAFSVEWYGTLITQAQDQRPWGIYGSQSQTNVFLARKGNDSDKLRFGGPTGQNAIISDSIASAIALNTPLHVVCTADGSTLKMYVNKVLQTGPRTGSSAISAVSREIRIGRDYYGDSGTERDCPGL